MDEQMIERLDATEAALSALVDKLFDAGEREAGLLVSQASASVGALAQEIGAAHSVMAGKVAELTQALKPFAEAADFKESGYTFEVPDTAYCDVTLKDCRKARAALAPHPKGME